MNDVERMVEVQDLVTKKRNLKKLQAEIETLKKELVACRKGLQKGGLLYWLWRRNNLDNQIKALEEEKAKLLADLKECKGQKGGTRRRRKCLKGRRTLKA